MDGYFLKRLAFLGNATLSSFFSSWHYSQADDYKMRMGDGPRCNDNQRPSCPPFCQWFLLIIFLRQTVSVHRCCRCINTSLHSPALLLGFLNPLSNGNHADTSRLPLHNVCYLCWCKGYPGLPGGPGDIGLQGATVSFLPSSTMLKISFYNVL